MNRLFDSAVSLGDSTGSIDTAQSTIFIRKIVEGEEELLLSKGITTGLDIFEVVNKMFKCLGLKWTQPTGGAPDVVDEQGFIGIVNRGAIELNIHQIILTNRHCIV